MKTIIRVGVAAALCGISGLGLADSPANGIGGIAVSPDGATVVVAGDTRVIYKMDTASMEVTDRIYQKSTIVWMDYRLDGEVLFTRDTNGTLTAYDTATFEPVWSVKRSEDADYAPFANQLVYVTQQYKDGKRTGHLTLVDAAALEEKATFDLGEMTPAAVGISKEGLRAVVLSRPEKRESEERANPPSDLKGIDRSVFRLKNDQRGAKIAQVDLILGQVGVTQSWYSTNTIKDLVVTPSMAFIGGFSNQSAVIDAAGEVTIVDSGARIHHGATLTATADAMVTGAQGAVVVKPFASDAAQEIKLDRLPGWPENVTRFDHGPDGKIYGGTTAYRVIVLDPATGNAEAYPVY
ncbi:MAG: hypothetical protein AAGB15_03530 [Pseudomonadota bacterium]